jgi:hypothetical protein
VIAATRLLQRNFDEGLMPRSCVKTVPQLEWDQAASARPTNKSKGTHVTE